MPTHLYPQDS
ncbi:hypothetical protein L3Y34_017259 [Caenorhabditis briggsae]|uniref:Uncharacterized protein n=1 Tax=Caenorhabditis briggsae TaxID=6238 RepID=A0AAE9DIH5_CAEBR|nr:hypothetical protein L3Y34_017259 [Caenorhabditis briggsae]